MLVSEGITNVIPAHPDFDLRFEGSDAVLTTPVNQPNLNRGSVCFTTPVAPVFVPVVMKN